MEVTIYFDGFHHRYFHASKRRRYSMWESGLFNYNQWEILRCFQFNLHHHLEEFHFDGSWADGITLTLHFYSGIGEKFWVTATNTLGYSLLSMFACIWYSCVNDACKQYITCAVPGSHEIFSREFQCSADILHEHEKQWFRVPFLASYGIFSSVDSNVSKVWRWALEHGKCFSFRDQISMRWEDHWVLWKPRPEIGWRWENSIWGYGCGQQHWHEQRQVPFTNRWIQNLIAKLIELVTMVKGSVGYLTSKGNELGCSK